MGLRRGAAAWGCAGARQWGAVQVRSSVGLRRGAAVWAARARSGVGPRRGAAARAVQGRSSVGPRGGAAAPGAQGCSSVGMRRGAARGHAGAQQCGAAQGRSGVGLLCRVEERAAGGVGPCSTDNGPELGPLWEAGGGVGRVGHVPWGGVGLWPVT